MKGISKILIADDSDFMRLIIRNILNKEGITEIYDAIDGNEAIKKYVENNPDIVIMDLVMPNKSGLEAIDEIRKHDPNAKVIIVTALKKQSDFDEKKYDVSAYINKPFEHEELIRAVKDNINR